jgi:hypothetical protein
MTDLITPQADEGKGDEAASHRESAPPKLERKFPEPVAIHQLRAARAKRLMAIMAKARRRRPGQAVEGEVIVGAKLLPDQPHKKKRRKIGRRAVLVHHALVDLGGDAKSITVEDIGAHLTLKQRLSDENRAALSYEKIREAVGALERAGFAEVQLTEAPPPEEEAGDDEDAGYRAERNGLTAVHRQVLLTLTKFSSQGGRVMRPLSEIADAAGLTVFQTRRSLVALERVRPYPLIDVKAAPGRALIITLRGFNVDKVRFDAKAMTEAEVATINGALLARAVEPNLQPEQYVALVALACAATEREDGVVAATVTIEALTKPIFRRGKCISDPLLGWDARHIERAIADLCSTPERPRSRKSPAPPPLSQALVRQLPLPRRTEAEKKLPNTYVIEPVVVELGRSALKSAATKSKRKASAHQGVEASVDTKTPCSQTGRSACSKSDPTPSTQTGGSGSRGYPLQPDRPLLEVEGGIADGHLDLVLRDGSTHSTADGVSTPPHGAVPTADREVDEVQASAGGVSASETSSEPQRRAGSQQKVEDDGSTTCADCASGEEVADQEFDATAASSTTSAPRRRPLPPKPPAPTFAVDTDLPPDPGRPDEPDDLTALGVDAVPELPLHLVEDGDFWAAFGPTEPVPLPCVRAKATTASGRG